jgi:hypothetical protein
LTALPTNCPNQQTDQDADQPANAKSKPAEVGTENHKLQYRLEAPHSQCEIGKRCDVHQQVNRQGHAQAPGKERNDKSQRCSGNETDDPVSMDGVVEHEDQPIRHARTLAPAWHPAAGNGQSQPGLFCGVPPSTGFQYRAASRSLPQLLVCYLHQ